MKILSILGIICSLLLFAAGFMVSQINCYTGNSYSSSIPDDADTWGYTIIGIALFFLIYSIAVLKKK